MEVYIILIYILYLTQTTCAIRPNIVFILADDLGYGDLSCTGSPINLTPNIDYMANNGIFLTNYYSAAPLCTPSRGSMLTGKYFRKLGLYPGVLDPFSIGGLNKSHTTYVSILKNNGYSTTMIGKWHLGIYDGHDPLSHGFDNYFGMPFSHDECTNDINWTGSTVPYIYGPCPIFDGKKIIKQGNMSMMYIDELYLQKSYEHITTLSKPFYLHIGSHHTHFPQYPENIYASSVRQLDNFVGSILKKIKETDNNTIIIFTSDNGAPYWYHDVSGNNLPFRCSKGSTWEGSMRVPAIMFGVNIKKYRSNIFMTGLDWYSTLLSAAQISNDNYYDGYNMWNVLTDNQNGNNFSLRKSYFFHSVKTFDNISSPGSVMAARHNNLKYHKYTSGGICRYDDFDGKCLYDVPLSYEKKIFDLESDPSERVDLTERSGIIDFFNALITEHIETFEDAPSEMLKGMNKTGFPCANMGCSGYPQCCKT